MAMRIGIDLGGTKIEGIALASGGAELARLRLPTPRDSYASTITAIRDLVSQLKAESGQSGSVGIAIPGAISPATGLIKNANSTWLNGRPFDRDLAEALGQPVRLANDANCFALSEAVDGAAAGFRVVFGVILGTGCGGGIIIDGQPLIGAHAIGGEWGHNPLPWPTTAERTFAPECYCGKSGCIETWISGSGFAADHARECDEVLSASDIISRAAAGDDAASSSLNMLADRLARGLASVINIIDPDCIVLGGGLSNADALYAMIPDRLSAYVFSDHVAVPVLKNKHGDSSGVRGAAWLWPENGSDV